MNTAEYCLRGRELKAELEKAARLYRVWGSPKIMWLSKQAYQRYRQHVDECDICKQKEE